jgi:hypothetical protein
MVRGHMLLTELSSRLPVQLTSDALTFRVRCGLYDMQKSHIGYVIDVYFDFQHNDKGFPVQFDRKDG